MTSYRNVDDIIMNGSGEGGYTNLRPLELSVNTLYNRVQTLEEAGAPGADGSNGVDGTDGADGADGSNGVDGTDGSNGVDGGAGPPGADGSNGVDGADGVDGDPTDLGPLDLKSMISLITSIWFEILLYLTKIELTGMKLD